MVLPKQKITVTHDEEDIAFEDIAVVSDVWLRENKGSNANLTAINANGAVYLGDIDQEDNVKIEYKSNYSDSFTQVFGGYAVDLAPTGSASSGLLLPVKCYGYDIALDRMRAAIEYGVESEHPSLDTILEILTDASDGLIPKWTEKVLNTAIDSGYAIDTTYILDDATSHKYVPCLYTPINDCIKTILDMTSAAKYPNPSLHWTVIPTGTTPYFCLDEIGNHTTAAAKWPTNCPVTITPGENIAASSYGKLQMEANYIVYFGKYEWPTGEIMTEDAAASWTWVAGKAGSGKSDDADCKVGDNSVKLDLGAAGAADVQLYYPSSKDLALDFTKIGTRKSIPTGTFYCKPVNIDPYVSTGCKLWMGTGTTIGQHYYVKSFYNKLPSSGKWGAVEVSAGPYTKGSEEEWDVGAGSPDWSQIDYFLYQIYRPGLGQTYFSFDYLLINGIVTRGAYHSDSGNYKIKLVTDSLAKTTNLTAADDSGTVAQLAKADLIRSMTRPTVGSIKLKNIQPTILPGQLIVSMGFRITEVHHHFGTKEAGGVYTELQVTDDLVNSYPQENASFGPTAQYNALMKAVNPDFQDRDRGNLKARDIDIFQEILAKDYA